MVEFRKILYHISSIQMEVSKHFAQWIIVLPEVLKHFKHKYCVILIKIFKSIYGSNLYRF